MYLLANSLIYKYFKKYAKELFVIIIRIGSCDKFLDILFFFKKKTYNNILV